MNWILTVYTAVMAVVLLLCLMTFRYKREFFCGLDKQAHRLRLFYGNAAFLLDHVHRYLHKVNFEQVRLKLSRIHVDKADEKEVYLYMVSRLALSWMVFILVAGVGYIKCIEAVFSQPEKVTALDRPKAGEGDAVYPLVVKHGRDTGSINVTVPERKMTAQEAEEILRAHIPELMKKVLGKNDSPTHVTEDLHLIYELSDGISVTWEIDDTTLLEPSGRIHWEQMAGMESIEEVEDIKEETATVNCRAVLSLYEYKHDVEMVFVLDRRDRALAKVINDKIEWLSEKMEDPVELSLSEIMEEYDVIFYKKTEKPGVVYLFAAILSAIVIWLAKGKDTDRILEQRRQQLQADYAGIVSKLTILQEAGMTVLGAWDKIIDDYEKQQLSEQTQKRRTPKRRYRKQKERETAKRQVKQYRWEGSGKQYVVKKRYAYEEMKYARQLMYKGYSESEAYLVFGKRCGLHRYMKFANLLEQNIRKGTKGLKEILRAEVLEAFEERKALARKKGEEAGTKLLLPMGMMLVISIVIIIVPAILSFNI